MSAPGDVPPEVLEQLREVCLALPDAYEEPAWTGIRWRIRKRTFAHVLIADPDHQMAYARAADIDEPLCLLTFRSPPDDVTGLVNSGDQFFKPQWAPDVVGMVLDDDTEWGEVAELLTESFCVLAPKRLAAQVSGAALIRAPATRGPSEPRRPKAARRDKGGSAI